MASFNFAEDASDNPTFYADLTNPQSLNKYQYCYNDPLSYTDLDGHCPDCSSYVAMTARQNADALKIDPAAADVGKALAKSALNNFIAVDNMGRGVTGQEPREYYRPSNQRQADVMDTADKVLFIASFATGRGGSPGVIMGRARAATIVTGEVVAVRNAHLAGKPHPKTGVPFDAKGFPDFKAAGVVKKEVTITQTGTRAGDFRAANKAAGFKKTPKGYTWHHHQDRTTMQLVPRRIHARTGHDGGFIGKPEKP